MAHLRSKKGNYDAEFYDPDRQPKRKWVSLRTRDKSVARQHLSRMEREYAMGMHDPWEGKRPQEGVTASDGLAMFLKSRRDRGCRQKSITKYDEVIRPFIGTLPPGLLLGQVESRHIRSYLEREYHSREYDGEQKKIRPSTRRTYWCHLRVFFRWAVKEGVIKSNPLHGVPDPQKQKKEAEFLMPEEVDKLVKAVEADAVVKGRDFSWLTNVIRFAVYTGLRLGEICDLRWGAIHRESGYLTVRDTEDFQTKSGHEGRIPIVPQAQKILDRVHEQRTSENPEEHVFQGARGGSLYANYVTERFRYYRKEANLPNNISFHSLRHTCASWLVMNGTPLRTVQAMLCHSTIDMTQRYAHLAPESFKHQVEKAFDGL